MTYIANLTCFLQNLRISSPLKYLLFGIASDRLYSSADEKDGHNEAGGRDIGQKIEKWVEKKRFLRKGLSLEQFASEMGVSQRFVHNHFRNVLKEDFRSWRTHLKINEAKEMLRNCSDKSIKDIYLELGFNDKSNFYRQFSKYTGSTPTKWRKSGADE